MANPIDFEDLTPAPTPAPKKKYHILLEGLDWPAGQTFASTVSAALPAAVKNKVLAFNAKISVSFTVDEA